MIPRLAVPQPWACLFPWLREDKKYRFERVRTNKSWPQPPLRVSHECSVWDPIRKRRWPSRVASVSEIDGMLWVIKTPLYARRLKMPKDRN